MATRALAGGGMLANEFIRLPYQFMNQVPPWVPRWGQEHIRIRPQCL